MTDLFGGAGLAPSVAAYLRDTNPWWVGKPGPQLPAFRRAMFAEVLRKLKTGPTPCVVVRGPRQVGKTTLQGQLIEHLVEREQVAPKRILRVQFDEIPSLAKVEDPVLAIARWFEDSIQQRTFNEAARAGETAYVLLDEVQNLRDWAPQIKSLVDHHTVRVLVTGSSSLRIEAGRDSLAGRISSVDMGTLLLREIAGLRLGASVTPALGENELERVAQRGFWEDLVERGRSEADIRDRAFAAFSARGGYPRAQQEFQVPWPEMADHLNETVIQRAIRHDLRMGSRGMKRDEALLEEVFRLACRYAGQAPGSSAFVPEVQQALHANIGWQRVLAYLRFLDGALLLRLIAPLEIRLKKRHAPSKICLCDHALRASWLQEIVPLDPETIAANPHLADIAGRIAESAAGYFLASIPHLDLAHFPERGAEPEVDYILTVGAVRIPLELKYRMRIDPFDDTRGLRAFLEKSAYNAPFGILVTMRDDVSITDPRIITVPLSTLLWMR
jgi:predicted AAA+ superfamily ATPase